MSVKVIDNRKLKFRPIEDYLGEELTKDWKGCTWSMLFTSKDNPHVSAHIERIPKTPPVESTSKNNKIVYILDGDVIRTFDGKTYHLYKGDFISIGEGDVGIMEIPEYVSLLIFYHPPLDTRFDVKEIP